MHRVCLCARLHMRCSGEGWHGRGTKGSSKQIHYTCPVGPAAAQLQQLRPRNSASKHNLFPTQCWRAPCGCWAPAGLVPECASAVANRLAQATPAHPAAQAGALVLLDSCQYVPHRPTDVQALGCDFLVASGGGKQPQVCACSSWGPSTGSGVAGGEQVA